MPKTFSVILVNNVNKVIMMMISCVSVLAIICLWLVKTTSLPKLYYRLSNNRGIAIAQLRNLSHRLFMQPVESCLHCQFLCRILKGLFYQTRSEIKLFLQKNAKFLSAGGSAPRPLNQPLHCEFLAMRLVTTHANF